MSSAISKSDIVSKNLLCLLTIEIICVTHIYLFENPIGCILEHKPSGMICFCVTWGIRASKVKTRSQPLSDPIPYHQLHTLQVMKIYSPLGAVFLQLFCINLLLSIICFLYTVSPPLLVMLHLSVHCTFYYSSLGFWHPPPLFSSFLSQNVCFISVSLSQQLPL